MEALLTWCHENNYPVAEADGWAKGGDGMLDLANKVVEITDHACKYQPIYDVEDSIETKIRKICETVYGSPLVEFSELTKTKIQDFIKHGWNKLPVCMAKTPLSLSDDPTLKGRPENFVTHITDISVSAGAGFVVVYTGNVLTMPGLPKVPAAVNMGIDENGETYGLF